MGMLHESWLMRGIRRAKTREPRERKNEGVTFQFLGWQGDAESQGIPMNDKHCVGV